MDTGYIKLGLLIAGTAIILAAISTANIAMQNLGTGILVGVALTVGVDVPTSNDTIKKK